MSKAVIAGWIVLISGTILWPYGYFATGHPSLIDWHTHTPWWMGDYLPNVGPKIGMTLMCASMVLIYWPSPR